ncbi:response regulator, partial [Chloroflexota bacterium]
MAKKILVIDDDSGILRFLSDLLEQEGHRVLTASNSLEGFSKAREESPDLLILDVMLPGLDGFEVCHRLRTDPQTARLPILMLSAKAHEEDRATGLRAGADDYLMKPADPLALVSRVEALLARRIVTDSKIVAFLGSKQGVGTTTLAVNVAVALSQQGKRVNLVDLCPYGGNAAAHLNLSPNYTIAELLSGPAAIVSQQNLQKALAAHYTGLNVISSPPFPVEYEDASPHVAMLCG